MRNFIITFPAIKTDKILIKIIRVTINAIDKSPKTAMMRGLKLLLQDFLVSYDLSHKE